MLICSSIRTRFHWTTFADGLRNQDAKTDTWMPKQKSSRVSDVRSWQGQGWKFLQGNLVGGGLTWQVKWRGADVPIQLSVLCRVPYCIWVFNLQLRHCTMCSQRQVWKPGKRQNVYTQDIGHNQTLGTVLEFSLWCWAKNLQFCFIRGY